MANTVLVEYEGEERNLVATVAKLEKANKRLEKQLGKVAKWGKKSGKAVATSYEGSRKRAAQLAKQVRSLAFQIQKSGRATDEQARRLRRLQRAYGLTQERVRGADRAVRSSNSAFATGAQRLGSFAAGFLSVGMAIRAFRIHTQAIAEDVQAGTEGLKEFQDEFINLQFLGDWFKDPKIRQKVQRLAKAARLEPAEVAKGLYTLESMTAYATPAKRAEYAVELLKMRKGSSTTLPELVPTFSKMGAIYPGLSGQELSNISQFLLEKAAVKDPEEVAKQAPKAFAAGLVGKVDARTVAAVFAVLTAKTGTPALAASGIKQMMMKVMLADPDDAEALRTLAFGQKSPLAGRKALLKEAGIAEKDNAYERLLKLAEVYERRGMSAQELKDLFGERAAAYGVILFSDPEGLKRMVEEFRTKTGPDVDIIGTKLRAVTKTDPMFSLVQAGLQADIRKGVALQSRKNVILANYEKIREAYFRELDTGGLGRASVRLVDSIEFAMSGRSEEAVVERLVRRLEMWGVIPLGEGEDRYKERSQAREAMARELLGVTPVDMEPGLAAAARDLFSAAEKLTAAADSLADALPTPALDPTAQIPED